MQPCIGRLSPNSAATCLDAVWAVLRTENRDDDAHCGLAGLAKRGRGAKHLSETQRMSQSRSSEQDCRQVTCKLRTPHIDPYSIASRRLQTLRL